MLTEARLRDALHEATASLAVHEELAWQRAWLEVARAPGRRAGRLTVAFAAVATVALALLGWQVLFHGTGVRTTVRSGRGPTTASSGAAPGTIFDALVPGQAVAPDAFIDAVNQLAAARGTVSGALTTANANATFAVGTTGEYRVTDAVATSIGLGNGTTVVVNSQRRTVELNAVNDVVLLGPATVVVPNDLVDYALRPGAWVAGELASDHLTITFVRREQVGGRAADEFSVKFASSTVYAPEGWELQLDARTGVLLAYTVHFAGNAAANSQTVSITNFNDNAPALMNDTAALPAAYAINAVVDSAAGAQPVLGLTVPTGATVASVIDEVRAAAASTGASR
jgi:hypothetical protein